MDTKLIQQYGEDILCYRLRTARQRKRMQYEDHDKQLMQLHKKENALYQQHKNLGWEPLRPPVQKGWIRHFELREDVANSKHGDFFWEILKKINTYQYDWKKDFKKKTKRKGKKIYVVKPQYLLRPYPYQFTKMEFTEQEQRFFREVWELDLRKELVKRYEFIESWRYVLKIRPNMIVKIRVKDALLESEMDLLDNYLERNDLRKRMNRLLHGYHKYRNYIKHEKYNDVYEFKHKSLIQILDLIKLG